MMGVPECHMLPSKPPLAGSDGCSRNLGRPELGPSRRAAANLTPDSLLSPAYLPYLPELLKGTKNR